jgi:drug/metabolite transporter (DMT)-like permease
MNNRIVPVIAISFIWAGIFNLCKKATELNDNIVTLGFIKTLLIGLISIIALIFYQVKNTKVIENIKNVDNNVWLILIVSCTLEVASAFFYFHSLKNNDATWSIPMIEAGVILISVIVSIYVFKEKLTLMRIIGILTIILGMYLVYLT